MIANFKKNEITSVSGATTPTFDATGNLTTDETGRQFVYDAWNRLVTVKDSGGTVLETLGYDVFNQRVSVTTSTATTDLYYSSDSQVLEVRVGGVAAKQYVWSPVGVDVLVERDRDTDANGTLDERLYVLQDAGDNVTALVNTSGAVVERFVYDPYGAATVLDASWGARSGSAYDWTVLWQGQHWDSVSGLYWFREGGYSPTLGRWVTTGTPKFWTDTELGNNHAIEFILFGDEKNGNENNRFEKAKRPNLIINKDGAEIDMSRNQCTGGYGTGKYARPPQDKDDYPNPFKWPIVGLLAPDKFFDRGTWRGGLDRMNEMPRDFVPPTGEGLGSVALPGEVLLPGPGFFRAGKGIVKSGQGLLQGVPRLTWQDLTLQQKALFDDILKGRRPHADLRNLTPEQLEAGIDYYRATGAAGRGALPDDLLRDYNNARIDYLRQGGTPPRSVYDYSEAWLQRQTPEWLNANRDMVDRIRRNIELLRIRQGGG